MLESRPPRVLIHALGAAGSGRTTLVRRYFSGTFDNSFDPIGNIGPIWKRVNINGMKVDLGLEMASPDLHNDKTEVNSYLGSADDVLLVMSPATPKSMKETARLRLDALGSAPSTKGVPLERVMKDHEVPWRIDPSGNIDHIVVEELGAEERSRMVKEWRGCVEPGYDLVRRLGVEAHTACPRAGEGVKEVIGDLVLQVLEERKATAEVLNASRTEAEDDARQRAKEKRAGPCKARLKSYLRVAR